MTTRAHPSLLALALLATLVSGCGSTPIEESFEPIFNGEDLDGWVQVLASPWRVEDRVLVSDQDPNGRRDGESWLFTKIDYVDFELRLEYRITEDGNSGVFFRDPVARKERVDAADGGAAPWDVGYEVNINGKHPEYPTGSVWAALEGRPGLQVEGQWNELQMRVKGDQIWTWVNGTPALSAEKLPERSKRGGIGFQRHGGASYRDKRIEMRNIGIRDITAAN